jgi:hypothetical protein
MVVAFPATEPSWALRAYLVLIGCAADRQTVTYGELATRIKRGGPNLLSEPLDCITRWCTRNGLPQLASLVVEESTSRPAPGFTAVVPSEVPAEQEKVWARDWYSFFPPTLEELAHK